MFKSKYYHEDIKKIKTVEFSILSNEETKKMSAVKKDPFGINLAESYNKYEPQKGGLVDLRLGTCDPYLNCTTCGLNTKECPGHFGHTELPDYFFNYGYLNHLRTILQCVCVRCSSLLVENSAELYEKIKHKKGKVRFQEVKDLAKKSSSCYNCGATVPKVKREVKETGAIRIVLEQEVSQETTDEETGEVSEMKKKVREEFTPRQIYEIFRNINETDSFLLGFNSLEGQGRPQDMLMRTFPIPPVIIRPSAKIDMLTSSTQEDSLTLKIADIIKKSNDLRKKMSKEQASSLEVTSGVPEATTLLQLHIATFFDNEGANLPKSEFKTGGKTTKSVSERLKGKPGRVRGNLMGKRQNYCGRSVITCDPNLSIDEVGIPLKVARNLTVPEIVTPQNIEHLSKLIRNGDKKYPGANFVTKRNTINGKNITQRIDLRIRKKAIKLNFGDVVDRHLVDGDYVLFNRQPSLHKPSMMGHRVRVAKEENVNTFRMSVSVCEPYNADGQCPKKIVLKSI